MNKYGRQAETMWKLAAPARYAELEDPEAFFTGLGEQAMEMVLELETKIAGPDRPGEAYLEKVGRLNAARNQAEEIARAEILAPPETEEPETETDEDPDNPRSNLLAWLSRRDREIDEEEGRS
ncbi:TnpV protein [Sinomonas mesophila]|uniref:TnpV protein n=1 Tax=Sinomonas mesophila TaxID=1531955 RepID=UPI001FE50C9A|nr:TnpV protein [Sinomonas mesophila]